MKITQSSTGQWAVSFRFNRAALDDLKMGVPWYERKWNGPTKQWFVDPTPNNEAVLRDIAQRYFGKSLPPMPMPTTTGTPFRQPFEIHYIGAPKERAGKTASSAMLSDGKWRVIIPEDVIKSWFISGYKPDNGPAAMETEYTKLGVSETATAREIKKAYRLAARTWHPDVNNDPDAADMFIKIDTAYKILSDPVTRARYDAGLKLQASMSKPKQKHFATASARSQFWKPPIRCGNITCEGTKIGDFYHVERIIQWDEIRDQYGRSMVASWVYGDDAPTLEFI